VRDASDKAATQKKFKTKNKLPYDLISDPKGEVAKALGVSMKLNKFMQRQAMLFKNDKLVWIDTKGATNSQGADVLKVINKNK